MWDTRVLGGIVILGVAIAMVVVGALNLEACENDGALYLVVNGSFLLGFPFLAGIIFIHMLTTIMYCFGVFRN